MSVRVRYAPSPTGLQHIGSVRTALFDYLFARSMGGTFVLRIEDTDRERFNEESLQDIYDTFEWLGIKWDEGPDVGGEFGPYIQTERAEIYAGYAKQLLDTGKAYYAYDTPEELAAQRESDDGRYNRKFRNMSAEQLEVYRKRGDQPVVRLKVPLDGSTSLNDIVLGELTWNNEDIPVDPVLVKSDGLPTYHLAAMVDDHLMEITHVLRGPEWIPSAPIHVLLYQAFGWTPPAFCHLPLVVGEDGKKLSKRHGSTRVLEFREKGYLPEALINYLVRVGWSYDDKQEIFSKGELEKLFTIDKINKAPAVFDYKKLDWLNGHYIRELSLDRLYQLTVPFVVEAGIVDRPPTTAQESVLRNAMGLVQERLKHLSEVSDLLRFLFAEPQEISVEQMIPKKLDASATLALLKEVEPLVRSIPDQSDEQNEHVFRAKAEALETKLGNLLMPLRVAITGSRISPPLFGSIRILGGDAAARRVAAGIKLLEAAVG